jgi:hypothetical protein
MSYWGRITSTGDKVCYVCDQQFQKNQKKVFVGRYLYTDDELYRHEHCHAGTENWKKKFGWEEPKKAPRPKKRKRI